MISILHQTLNPQPLPAVVCAKKRASHMGRVKDFMQMDIHRGITHLDSAIIGISILQLD